MRGVRTYSSVQQGLLDQLLLHGVEGGGVLDAVILHGVRVVVTLTDFTGHDTPQSIPFSVLEMSNRFIKVRTNT